MKVTICDKGEGFVTAKYEAQSPIEAMMLSTSALTEAEATVELKSENTTDWTATPPIARHTAKLTFNGFHIPVHAMLTGK